MNRDERPVIALDVGGSSVKSALVAADQQIVGDVCVDVIQSGATADEILKMLAALKRNRHGHRDWLIGLLIYRHGLRVSEACDLRWDDISLPKRTITGRPTARPIRYPMLSPSTAPAKAASATVRMSSFPAAAVV